MSEAKIEIKAGAFSFTGEGTEKWLSSELDKLLAKLPDLVELSPPESGGDENGGGPPKPKKGVKLGTLASFLRDKSATENQVKKFLVAALWLHDTTGKERLTTREVRKALSDAKQSKLTNPAACLNQNVSKGYAEKDGSTFFLTEPGRASLGL